MKSYLYTKILNMIDVLSKAQDVKESARCRKMPGMTLLQKGGSAKNTAYVLLFFLFISTAAFGQTESKLDSLFYRFQHSVNFVLGDSYLHSKDTSGFILFSIKITLNKKGDLKLLQLSDNTPTIVKEDLAAKASKINYEYFKELVAQTKGNNRKTAFIIPVLYSKKPNIHVFQLRTILNENFLLLFSYDHKLEAMDKIKLITPLISMAYTIKN